MSEETRFRVVQNGDDTTVEIGPLGWVRAAPVIHLFGAAGFSMLLVVLPLTLLKDAWLPSGAPNPVVAVLALLGLAGAGFCLLAYVNNALRWARLTAGPLGLTLNQREWFRIRTRTWSRPQVASVAVETQEVSGPYGVRAFPRCLAINLLGGEVVRLQGYRLRDEWETVAAVLQETLAAAPPAF